MLEKLKDPFIIIPTVASLATLLPLLFAYLRKAPSLVLFAGLLLSVTLLCCLFLKRKSQVILSSWMNSADDRIEPKQISAIHNIFLPRLLFQLIRNSHDPNDRRKAISFFPLVKNSSMIRFAVRILEDDAEKPKVRASAANILPELSDREALDPLRKALSYEEPHVVLAAIDAIATLSLKSAYEALLNRLKEPNENHYILMKLLDSIGDMSVKNHYTEAIDVLEVLLMTSKEPRALVRATEIIKRVGGAKGEKALSHIIECRRPPENDSNGKYREFFQKLATAVAEFSWGKEMT